MTARNVISLGQPHPARAFEELLITTPNSNCSREDYDNDNRLIWFLVLYVASNSVTHTQTARNCLLSNSDSR